MIPHGPLAALIALFDAGCVLVIGIAAYASLVAIADGVRDMPWRRRRRYRGLRDLMDTGDGQGGVPPLPRREPTRLVELGDLVAYPELERYAQHKAAQALTEIIGHHGHADATLGDLDPDPGLGGER